jgi:AcrR family transcriptional regulator
MTREERKRSYLKSFIHTFSENGIDRTPIKKLAGAAKINEASIYQYFTNKDEIVVECVRLYLNEELTRLFEILSEPEEPLEIRIRKFLQLSSKTSAEARFIIQVLTSPVYSQLCSPIIHEFSEYILSLPLMKEKRGNIPQDSAESAIKLLLLSIFISDRVIGKEELLRIQLDYLLRVLYQGKFQDPMPKNANLFYAV